MLDEVGQRKDESVVTSAQNEMYAYFLGLATCWIMGVDGARMWMMGNGIGGRASDCPCGTEGASGVFPTGDRGVIT